MKAKKQKAVKEKLTQKEQDKMPCSMCYGYGWYPIGNLCPIGQMDAHEWGDKVIMCPWCGKGFAQNEKYEFLLERKKELEINKDERGLKRNGTTNTKSKA